MSNPIDLPDLFVSPEPEWTFSPLLVVAIGIGQIFWHKYVFPMSDQTLEELDRKSIDGMGALPYTVVPGIVTVIIGLVMFIIMNWDVVF